jgi:non-specific serine/threonine protein kinase/serine/threonine-protein kinase
VTLPLHAPAVDHVGPYRLERELGRGGMGVVYLGVRDDALFDQRVAVKVVKRGMDTDAILERFRQERQILAGLSHPNIARLLDGGTTADGRPYFVMEFIDGLPLLDSCDRRGLDVSSRLRLFLAICAAVQYAHQNLVVHRDLKPGNVLVTADGTAKLLDFGIAKIVSADGEAETATVTRSGQRLMTPEYASPEQIRGEPVSTVSDVYALGVMLYELLTGVQPFALATRSPDEILRIVCSEDPPRPSTAVTRARTATGGGSRDETRLDPSARQQLRRRLAGDLDNIVLKAMAKEPSRRYGSAEQLADDIRRHLTRRPVSARPDTLGYRVSTFIRRNKAGVLAAALVAASLVVGLIGTIWQWREAQAERQRAEQRLADVRALANAMIFDIHDSIAPLAGSTPARALLVRRALEYLDRVAGENSDVDVQRDLAAAYMKLGDVQGRRLNANLGDSEGALASHRKALRLREQVSAARPGDPSVTGELATSHARVGEMLQTSGDTTGATAEYRTAVRLFEQARRLRPQDAALSLELSSAYDRLGYVMAAAGDTRGALDLYRQSRQLVELIAGPAPEDPDLKRMLAISHQRIGNTLGNPNYPNLGDTAGAATALQQAIDLLTDVVAARPTAAPARRALAAACSNLSDVRVARGELDAADEALGRALRLYRELLESDSSDAQARRDVALVRLKEAHIASEGRRFVQARVAADAAVAEFEVLAAADPKNTALQGDVTAALSQAGDIRIRQGAPDEALPIFVRMTRLQEAIAQQDPGNVEVRYALGIAYSQLGEAHAAAAAADRTRPASRWREAAAWYERSLEIFKRLEQEGALTGSDAGQPARLAGQLEEARRRSTPPS